MPHGFEQFIAIHLGHFNIKYRKVCSFGLKIFKRRTPRRKRIDQMVFAGQHLFKRGQDVLFVIDNYNMRHALNPVVANRVAVGTVKSRPQSVFAPVHEFCITYQLICTIWANYMHMGEVGLDLQVEAEPEEQTAIWSISPKLCQIAQFLWRGHTLPRQSKKGKEYGTCWNSDDC